MARTSTERQTRIILEPNVHGDHWFAWLEGEEFSASEGQTARLALKSLLAEAATDFQLTDLIEDTAAYCEGHIECISGSFAECPDCRGSGKYTGLSVVEDCRKCGGVGRSTPPRVDVIKRRNAYRVLFDRFFHKHYGYTVRTFGQVSSYISQLAIEPDCVICGMDLRDGGPLDLLDEFSHLGISTPVVISTGMPDYESDLMQRGAFGYLIDADIGRDHYIDTVKRAISTKLSRSHSV